MQRDTRNRVPAYRRQTGSGRQKDRAFVVLGGERHYLGDYGSPDSREAYARLLAEHDAAVRRAARGAQPRMVVELVAAFWQHATVYYRRPDGSPTGEADNFQVVLRPLLELYGRTDADGFRAGEFRVVRDRLVARGLTRKSINRSMGRLRQVFRWGVEHELVDAAVLPSLQAVSPLRRGRSDAAEADPVQPVSWEHVAAIERFVTAPVWAMVRVQWWTGARSGELISAKPQNIDTTEAVWIYEPDQHKTAHHGHRRRILIGPEAQRVLRPLLVGRRPGDFIFSPADAPRNAASPGTSYSTHSYRRAVERGCRRAGIPSWSPHQLRHAAASRIDREHGVEITRIILGHATAASTELYVERDLSVARRIVAEIG